MAQQTTVELVDDLDGTKGTETINFGIDGVHLEIDLNTKNAKALRKAVAEFVAAARTIKPSTIAAGRAAAPRTRARAAAPAASTARNDKDYLVAVRTWAAENKIKVAARGRIAADVFAQYETTHASA